jgi:hypothetical protein
VIRENNITAPIKDPIKDTLVPLWTTFNANGSVRWRTFVYLNLFYWQMGKNHGTFMPLSFLDWILSAEFSSKISKHF